MPRSHAMPSWFPRQQLIMCLVGCMSGLVVAQTSRADQSGSLALAGRVLRADGTLQDNAVVIVSNGKIDRVVDAADAGKTPIRQLGPEAVIWPGMIDLFAAPGAVGQTVEDAETVDPDATPIDLIDPSHPDFRHALESGITAVTIAPQATDLVSGVCVTVRTHAVAGRLETLRDDGPLILGFREGVWRLDREPTSPAGAVHDLRQLLAQAHAAKADRRMNAAVAGKLDAWIACSRRADIIAIRSVLGDDRAHFGVIHSADAIDAVAELRDMHGPVVIGPYSMESSRRVLLGAAALADADIEVAFRAGFPESAPNALRLTAALAVRHGMKPAAARRAITIAPAKVAGVADRLGSVAPGKDADLVVFSRDPLRLDARVLEVFVHGEPVYSAAYQSTPLAGGQP